MAPHNGRHLATPATLWEPRCNGLVIPLGPSLSVERVGKQLGLLPVFHNAQPRLAAALLPTPTGEVTPARLPCGLDTTRRAAVTGYKPSPDWRKV